MRSAVSMAASGSMEPTFLALHPSVIEPWKCRKCKTRGESGLRMWSRSGHCKCNHRIPQCRRLLTVTTGGDYHVLLAARPQAIRHRHCLPARREAAFPKFSAGFDVEGAQIVVQGRSDEHEAAGGHNRPAQIRRPANDRS